MNPLVAPEAAARRAHTALSVNLNRVALLRNSRPVGRPNLLHAAAIALDAGADGITVHPRPDERHVRASDVHELSQLLKRWPHAEFNIEGNPLHNLMPLVRAVRPQQCTFVPDSTAQATSDHGWDLGADIERLRPLIAEAKRLDVRVSLFMDPQPDAMRRARDAGADRVELYTESYARAYGSPQQAAVLEAFVRSADAALAAGLEVNAGHDLNRENLADFLRAAPGVREVSIGHALIADAIELGLAESVRAYRRCIDAALLPSAR